MDMELMAMEAFGLGMGIRGGVGWGYRLLVGVLMLRGVRRVEMVLRSNGRGVVDALMACHDMSSVGLRVSVRCLISFRLAFYVEGISKGCNFSHIVGFFFQARRQGDGS